MMDIWIGCFIKLEVGHAETDVQSRVQGRGGKLVRERGGSVAQVGRDLGVHENVLRNE